MVLGLEKKKLERLYIKSTELTDFDEDNTAQLNEIYKDYVIIIKKLHSKEPNIFANIHKYGIAEMKIHKESIRRNANQENFDNFKHSIEGSMEDSMEYIKDYLHV